MTTHSSILAWRIPWTEEPGRLQLMGLQRVRHLVYIFMSHNGMYLVCFFMILSNFGSRIILVPWHELEISSPPIYLLEIYEGLILYLL